ncbi:hypothetical protein [Brevundimonas sp.]|uniref:hypothetical protein n=1 Tax=Brevundimonas sp. TaxID=1871086 RepID=UPI00391ACBCE
MQAELIMAAHVAPGALAVAAGAAALAAPKGRWTHVHAGRVFVIAMGLSSAVGAGLGLVRAETFYITFHAGVLALCLLASGWLAARARSGAPGPATGVVAAANLINVVALVVIGVLAARSGQPFRGFPAQDYLVLAGMGATAAAGDITLLWRARLGDRHRTARHLWRMCLGFFIAAGSAFTGPGAAAFSEAVRQSGVLALPELTILLLMLFWLARTLLARLRPEPAS